MITCPKIARKSRKLIDAVKLPGRSWQSLKKPIPLRRLWWKQYQRFWGAERVHFVEFGDYLVSELTSPAVKEPKQDA